MSNAEFDRIDEFARMKSFEYNAPGMVMSMKSPSGDTHTMSYGFSDVEKGEPADEVTCFGVASLSKIFTAISVLNLVESGKLELNDPVSAHFSVLENTVFDRITIHHLLSNSSGISTLGYAERSLLREIEKPSNDSQESEEGDDLLETVSHADQWVLSEPGSRFTYLNEGYGLLRILVGKIAGMAHEEFVLEKIVRPLELNNTFFMHRSSPDSHKIATGYSNIGGDKMIPVKPGEADTGGLYSNVKDMGRLLQTLIDRGKHNGRQVVPLSAIERIESQNVKVDSVEIGPDGPFSPANQYYGYGINIDSDFHGQKLFHHAGSIFYYTSHMAYIPETGSYFIGFGNSTANPLGNLAKYSLTLLGGHRTENLTFIRNESTRSHLPGTYQSLGGSISVDVSESGSYLKLKPNYSNESLLLIPEQIGEEKSTYYHLQGYNKIFAVFSKHDKGPMEVVYAGQRLKKTK